MTDDPSIGIAVCKEDGIEIFSLMDKADIIFLSFSEEALHEAQAWLQKKYPRGKFSKEPCLPVCRYFKEYIHGKRRDIPYPRNSPFLEKGTIFQKKVWAQISSIPYGETRTYGQLARNLGNAGYARAVGQACHNNPISLIIPCHRVVGTGGLGGFAGGTDTKKRLLLGEKKHKNYT